MPVAFYAAWLPRSFTLNALVRQLRGFASLDICAFGGKFDIVFGEADPPSVIVAPRGFGRIFFPYAVSV